MTQSSFQFNPTSFANNPQVLACKLWNSQNETLTNSGTNYYLSFDTIRFDTDNMTHPRANSPSTSQTGSIVIKTSGIYIVYGTVRFDPNITGRRAVFIFRNGDASGGIGFNVQAVTDSGGPTVVSCFGCMNLNSGDQVDLGCNQLSGGSLAIDSTKGTSSDLSPVLGAIWISPYLPIPYGF